MSTERVLKSPSFTVQYSKDVLKAPEGMGRVFDLDIMFHYRAWSAATVSSILIRSKIAEEMLL
jgi:hypothetical protein